MTLPTNEHIRVEFRRILNQRADIGVVRIISNWFFEPANIFDPNSRGKPKPEPVIVLAYVLVMALACVTFNFR
jgi:hypothetical protein